MQENTDQTVATLRAALEPFARWGRQLIEHYGGHGDDAIAGGFQGRHVTFGDLRRAIRAMGAPAEPAPVIAGDLFEATDHAPREIGS